VFVHEVARRWAEWGHRVLLCSSSGRGLPREDVEGSLKILRVGRLHDGSHHALAPRALIRLHSPDVILESINTVPYLLPLRRKGPPFLPLIHQVAEDVWDAHLPRFVSPLAKVVERGLFGPYRRRHAVAVSESTREDLLHRGLLDVDVVRPGGPGPQPRSPKEARPTLLFVGRLRANKRPEDAVEAFRLVRNQIPDARLWLVGDGKLRSRLEATLPSGAQLLGRLSRDELARRMARAHVLMVTSVREGWGLVVTEASAFGTPAVAYDVPGLRDSVRHGKTGCLVPPQPSELASAAVTLLRASDIYEHFSARASDWGGTFSWPATARDLLMHVSDAAGRSGQLRVSHGVEEFDAWSSPSQGK
jgi:glycosyltransferase involved in cell wall biosynthesis